MSSQDFRTPLFGFFDFVVPLVSLSDYPPPVLYSVSGSVRRLPPPQLTVETGGVGYLVTVPHPLYDELQDGSQATLILYTYVREDRLDLFGFATDRDRQLFSELIGLTGIGPKIALEICSIPSRMLSSAIAESDARTLTQIKGIGAKTAEKLLLELKSLSEKHPEWWASSEAERSGGGFDHDALAVLLSLGYDQRSAIDALKKLPVDAANTEERVRTVLRSLSGREGASPTPSSPSARRVMRQAKTSA